MLQVGSVNDISQSSHGLGHTGRLLRLRLTDGHLWLTAVEYHSIPSLSVDIPPGTKVPLLSTISCMLLIFCPVLTCRSFVMSEFFSEETQGL